MKLTEKGPFQPPPLLAALLEPLSQHLQTWSGVIAATHWNLSARDEIDGADFYVGDEELGHIHLDGETHIPFGKRLSDAIIAAGLARPFRWSAGWIELSVRRAPDVALARELFELNHARLQGAPPRALLARVQGLRGPANTALHVR